MGITEFLLELFTGIISSLGYPGITLLMVLESMVAPVPSEAIMPFAGFLIHDGRFSLWGIIAASTIGSIIGSLLSYSIGKWGGRPFLLKFGKYILLEEHHLVATERFFTKYGERTVFFSRFIPVVRHFISIPAGMGKMHLGKFLIYTTIGAGLWNTFLGWLGFALGERWETIRAYAHVLDVVVVIAIVCGIVYLIAHRYRSGKK